MMDYVNNAVEYGLAIYAAVVQMGATGWRAATSKTAQRTLVKTVLFGSVSALLFGFACLGYLAFYHNYLPDQVVTLPMHLQYGYAPNPYGVLDLTRQSFGAYQDYDVSVTLHLPRSPANLGRGNFMLAIHFVDDTAPPPPPDAPVPEPAHVLAGRRILHSAARAAIIPYTDPLVSLASRVLFLAYHILVPASETVTLALPLVEHLEFRPGTMQPTALVVDVQAGQALQVYRAAVIITAQLTGLRWFMHTWWFSSFVLFTTAFWLCEVFVLAMSFVVLWSPLSRGGEKLSTRPKSQIKDEPQPGPKPEVVKQEEDVPMTFPTLAGQPPLRYDPAPQVTWRQAADPPDLMLAVRGTGAGADADADDEDDGRDEEADERARDSGIGTSYSERDSGALRRRSSRGRMRS